MRSRFNLPDAQVVFAPSMDEIDPADYADTQILVGDVNRRLAENMPNMKFVQLFSAGANGYAWLPQHIVLANAYGAYGGFRAGINYPYVIDTAIRNLTLVLNGEPPIHEVDRELGY